MKLCEKIRVIYGKDFGKYPQCNCVLIGKSCLIDSGAEAVKELKVETILNSHWHEDHIAMNKIADVVYIHELDRDAVVSYEEFERRYGLGEFARFFVNFEFCDTVETFDDGDIFKFEGVEVEVIHTPGHSAGHCCFLLDGKILYLGDIDLTSFGPWYGCLDCDVSDFVKSIEKLEEMADDVYYAVPSHGKVVGEGLAEKLKNYKKIIIDRDTKIKELAARGENPVGKGIIYRRFPEPREIYEHFEKIMVEKHLTASLNSKNF